MWRLMRGRLDRGRGRLGEERGAVAVMVALLMVPLLGFAAIAVDVAAVHAERQALRNGADAAALAVAVDCARNACGNTVQTAASLAAANSGSMSSTLARPAVLVGPSSVTVTTTATQQHVFAPLIGVESSTASATSTAAWSGISHAVAAVPMAISRCAYESMRRGVKITLYPGEPGTCGGAPSSIWLNTDAGKCQATTSVGATLSRFAPPNVKRTDLPAACRPSGSSFPLNAVVDDQVHIPVFQQASGNAAPVVYGFVAFDIDDITLNERSFKVTNFWEWLLFIIRWFFNALPDDHGFKAIGTLGSSVELSTAPTHTTSAPDLGARSVYLTERNPQ